MIGLILGTSEGKKLLSLINKYTEDIFVSTATEYGGELLKEYKYKHINTKPLDKDKLEAMMIKYNIKILIDASHPYAEVVTKNAMEVCEKQNITYIRYERKSTIDKYKDYHKLILVEDYEKLKEELKSLKGNILNTTGSRNVNKFTSMNIENRIIHRVLPTIESIDICLKSGATVENIIAIKGPLDKALNKAFIEAFDAKIIVMKDSGVQGGSIEKIEAAIELDLWVVVIGRKDKPNCICFNDENKLSEYLSSIL
ncbi:cobalt-precorrin-6A reductase [Clostridium algidicarnis]|uniref:cobalt-precorrin-6A reductase n=1 Tax=Clostridium algidicarnis TaxID=37659 RepID=UPI001C0B8F65|nr:cobalt-precorrin-6A reductase [Clostridium algidicarnis]MBU3195300.1 cobalt-precorrin-6A reductase [Clostridium algidicarnis]MBU3208259.1 cobalt-precorrin-6A reductase [Clostridium algidicarnis]MBU3227509.1 cobalt-precorrin-6A reductase [Clostridium algidicarnis]MBU3251084.1 cobalt-precorrin-6A reductase [Clostridium algidicarnis]